MPGRAIPIEGIFAVLFVVAVVAWEISMKRAKRASMADTHELSGQPAGRQPDEAGQLDYNRPAYGLADGLALPFRMLGWFFSWALRLEDQEAETAERPSKAQAAADGARAAFSQASGRSGRLSGLDERDLRAAMQAAHTPAGYEADLWAEPATPAPAAPAKADGPAGAHELIDGPADKRQHVIGAIGPGGGKTTLKIAMLLADLTKADEAGRPYQSIVLDPHFSFYHPDQQPTDLRPLKGRFEVYFDYAQIRDVLKNLVVEARARKAIFNRSEGEDLGHTIMVHIDEWPDIAACKELGELKTPAGQRTLTIGEECAFYLTELVRLARKYGLYVALWSQDARVKTLDFHGGVRGAFMTKVVGRGTDEYDWNALIGNVIERPGYIERGTYYVAGVLQGRLIGYVPDAMDVAAALRARPAHYRPMLLAAGRPAGPEEAANDARAARRLAAQPALDPNMRPLDEEAEAAEPASLYTAGWIDEAEREAAERWYDSTPMDDRSGRAFARWLYAQRGGRRSGYTGDGSFNSQVARLLYAGLQERLAT